MKKREGISMEGKMEHGDKRGTMCLDSGSPTKMYIGAIFGNCDLTYELVSYQTIKQIGYMQYCEAQLKRKEYCGKKFS